ISQAKH
ncbi:ATPase associated with various cellular activities family protein, partial [Vibrio parahaemolyticus V-223/04]